MNSHRRLRISATSNALSFAQEIVALSLRDRKAELPNNVDEAFGSPVAERQGYLMCKKTTFSDITL
jgi:hypothetical protein